MFLFYRSRLGMQMDRRGERRAWRGFLFSRIFASLLPLFVFACTVLSRSILPLPPSLAARRRTVLELGHTELGDIALVRELKRVKAHISGQLAVQVLGLGGEGEGDGADVVVDGGLVGHVHLWGGKEGSRSGGGEG